LTAPSEFLLAIFFDDGFVPNLSVTSIQNLRPQKFIYLVFLFLRSQVRVGPRITKGSVPIKKVVSLLKSYGTYVLFLKGRQFFRNISKTFEPILFKTIFGDAHIITYIISALKCYQKP
jgi:hypothetical protein